MPSGKRGRFPEGTPILQAARSLGVDIDSVCGGRATCGRCQVVVSEGEFAKLGVTSKSDHLSDFSAVEQRYGDKRGLSRAGASPARPMVLGDLVIDVPSDSQVHQAGRAQARRERTIELDPIITLHYVEVAEPDMHDPTGDLQRLEKALKEQWKLEEPRLRHPRDPGLQQALRKGEWKVTVAVHLGKQITAVWPGFHDKVYGLAVDIGSTTIAGHLCDLATGDVVASSGTDESADPLRRRSDEPRLLRDDESRRRGRDDQGRARGAQRHGPGRGEGSRRPGRTRSWNAPSSATRSCTTCCSASTRPSSAGRPLRWRPTGRCKIWATEIDLKVHPGARIYVLPCIAGHVGADTAGVILSEARTNPDEMTLIVDVGTNAEIVLGNKNRLLAASSPTGPAFEGAQISWGQRAAPGAIERVRIDRATLEPRFKVIGCDLWSDHPDFAAKTEGLGVTGVCGSGIIEAPGRDVSLRHHHPGRRRSTAPWRRSRRGSCRTAAPSPICCMTASRSSRSPRTTCARSSSPRRRSMPARGC